MYHGGIVKWITCTNRSLQVPDRDNGPPVEEPVHRPTRETHQERSEQRWEAAFDMKAWYERRRQAEANGIEGEDEQAGRQERQGKGQDEQDRPDDLR